jgi:DNA (cytosine-5)-methyltransferase 1
MNIATIRIQPTFQFGPGIGWAEQQQDLLARCAGAQIDLSAELARIGKGREDLRYSTDNAIIPGNISALSLDDFRKKKNGIPVVSFFSGCGGMDLGFEAAGFHHVALVEHNDLFCKTVRHNRPKWSVVGPPYETGDVSQREEIYSILAESYGIKAPFDGVFVGGPPCQPFSIASNQRFNKNGKNFKRIGFNHAKNGNLLFDMVWLIQNFKPTAFLIENVEGLYDVDDGEQIQTALLSLAGCGYIVNPPFVLDSAHFQVPQHRRRLFICGSRKSSQLSMPPKPNYTIVPCNVVLSKPLQGVANHETREHKPESILRYMALDYGERDQLGRVDRLDPRLPAKTVIAGGTKGGGRSHLHPHIPRTLTARECARLQTFPDDYIFLGPAARQFTQVGNAVPPVLAAQLAHSLHLSYFLK